MYLLGNENFSRTSVRAPMADVGVNQHMHERSTAVEGGEA